MHKRSRETWKAYLRQRDSHPMETMRWPLTFILDNYAALSFMGRRLLTSVIASDMSAD